MATNGWHVGDGYALFRVCAELGHEGVVVKRVDAPYPPGKRTRFWLKRKCPAWKRDHAPRRRPGYRRNPMYVILMVVAVMIAGTGFALVIDGWRRRPRQTSIAEQAEVWLWRQ